MNPHSVTSVDLVQRMRETDILYVQQMLPKKTKLKQFKHSMFRHEPVHLVEQKH